MMIQSTAALTGLVMAAGLLSGCVQPMTAQDSQPAAVGDILTPWGTSIPSSNPQTAATPSKTGAGAGAGAGTPASHPTDDNFVMAPDTKKAAITDMQRQQVDEARIALGILDRMAQRCVQQRDEAACNTLQANWADLSQQLHKSLAIISGDTAMGMNSNSMPIMGDPTTMGTPQITSPALPATGAPASTLPMKTMPDNGSPTMEKLIPMTQPTVDG